MKEAGVELDWDDAWTNVYFGSLIDEETGKIPKDDDGNFDADRIEGLYVKRDMIYLIYADIPKANEILNPKNDVVAEIEQDTDPILKVYDLWTSWDNLEFAMDDDKNNSGLFGWFVEGSIIGIDATVPMPDEWEENTEKLEQKLGKEGVRVTKRLQIGPTIGCHVGPGAYGVIFVTK